MEKMPDGSVVILAFDLDDAGEKLSEEVKALVPVGRKVRRTLLEPGTGKGWNEMLKYRLGLT
ncbi:MAG: toprim domain-containing protein [Alphaproteobacteria bacterium]|nr:toprim domain-containing protein [Alphaproteobacteria bacterium]